MKILTQQNNINVNVGAQVIDASSGAYPAELMRNFQLVIDSSASAGAWTIELQYVGSTRYVAARPVSSIVASGTDAYQPLVMLDMAIQKIRITPSGITAGTLYNVALSGWDND